MWIFDASTLILLAKSELLDIFLDDFEGTPIVPGAVATESTHDARRPDAVLIQQRIQEGRLAVRAVGQPKIFTRLVDDFRLGAGEAEALAVALDAGDAAVVVATDDRSAIRACKTLRIAFVTSLGILTRAVEKGLVTKENGRLHLERLASLGRFSEQILEEVRRQIGGSADGESSEDG